LGLWQSVDYPMACTPPRRPKRRTPISLDELVGEYLTLHRGKEQPTRSAYEKLPTTDAINNAAHLLVRTKSNEEWKRHPHFHRGWYYAKYLASFDEAAAELFAVRDAIATASKSGFDAVLAVVTTALRDVSGLKELAAYDITELLGYHFGFVPSLVHLHAGTLRGANAMFPANIPVPRVVSPKAFRQELRRLHAFEIEDFLCIFHVELANLRKRGLLP
jgi:hypothetical protein